MAEGEQEATPEWSSQTAFILAAMGSAVGLGNIWRFPYVAGENGGGAFVLIYLACILGLGLPALIATIMVGRMGRASPIRCLQVVALKEGLSRHWVLLGWLLVLSAYFLLSFFSVIASWTMDYMVKSVSGAFTGIDTAGSAALFAGLKADPLRLAAWHGLFMAMTLFIVSRGLRKGIERAIRIMMPALFLLVGLLALYAMLQGAAAEALRFLFVPDFSKISAEVVLLAVGQALLTLSVGGAGMLVYGAYLSQDASIPRAAAVVALADTLVALLAGLMIFPIVFAFGLTAGEGPGLIFVTMPMAFGQMTGGNIFGALFFLLLLIAALSSALSMFEPVVAWLAEKKGISRLRASLLAGLAAWLIGLSAAFSFNIWSEVRPLFFLERLREANIFRSLEYLVANISVPVGALLVVIFVGWMMSERSRVREFGGAPAAFSLWRFFMRFVVPLALLAILGARLLA